LAPADIAMLAQPVIAAARTTWVMRTPAPSTFCPRAASAPQKYEIQIYRANDSDHRVSPEDAVTTVGP